MGVTTTGSTVLGCVDGLARGPVSQGATMLGIYRVLGNPDGVVTAATGSDLAWDSSNGQYYMALGVGGSTWVKLISGTG
jgi:hypothetical protein